MPLAFFITFTTYGTWLHGTDKGLGSVDRQHNAYGTPFVEPNDEREERAADRMTDPPYVLDEASRRIVRDAIVQVCEEKRWTLLALHVRTNHVHVVISADREPGRLMSDLKARASRDLNRAAHDQGAAHEVSGISPKRWTRHGSTRYLFDPAGVAGAIDYVLNQQGPPMEHYDGTAHDHFPDAGNMVDSTADTRHCDHFVDVNKTIPNQRAAHEVSVSPPGERTNPLTSCAAPSKRAAGREISGLNAYEG